jgi:hypothetical protein
MFKDIPFGQTPVGKSKYAFDGFTLSHFFSKYFGVLLYWFGRDGL